MSTETVLPRSMAIEEFLPLVGEWMLADCDPEPVKIRLLSATPLADHFKGDRPPFVLTFFSPPHAQLLEGGYVLRCGQFGPDIVYISSLIPPHGGEAGFYYQAVFN